jgi:hypothetical protein
MSNLMRYDFICKGKLTISFDAASEEAARAMFAESLSCQGKEIIDVIEKEIVITPVEAYSTPGIEGFETVKSEPKASAEWIASTVAAGENV